MNSNNLIKRLVISLGVIILGSIILATLTMRTSQTRPNQETPVPTVFINTTVVPSPTTTPIPTKTVEESEAEIEQILPAMPISTPEFVIEYLYTSKTYIVTIMQNPYEEKKAKADQWFRDHGVTDLSKLKIVYNRDRFVQ